ncbi:tyrosine-type recombinase/integrase [Aliiglaciecola sp. CAU 1673]|uniref:tyrosine-type recombinase/integrase n=1 Tax=Aliiglaciecola sp. CAU 1673 TaxID=3032595 RepID=UPI0023DBBA8A|nr:tyrosine-type recombinase/integrase [Aliiglaciecola sp. CAU 1673]MDF2177942.1 tyrosine-type recombinase/integrase [Aliiglaciecola sp. CAU 1673]
MAKAIPHAITSDMERDARLLSDFYAVLIADLGSTTPSYICNRHDRAALVAVFAAIHGGLCHKEGVTALINQLRTAKRPLLQSDSWLHVELEFRAGWAALNHNQNGERVTLLRFFPDKLTLCAISAYLRHQEPAAEQDLIQEQDLWQLITDLWGRTGLKKLPSFERFCKAAAAMLLARNKNLPTFLVSYARGAKHAASMPLQCFQYYLGLKTKQAFRTNAFSTKHTGQNFLLGFNDSQESIDWGSMDEASAWISHINKALITDPTITQDNNWQQKIAERLEALLGVDSPVSVRILASRMIDKLISKRWKSTATPKKYMQEIGEVWLRKTINLSLLELDSDEVEALQNDIKSNIKNLTIQKVLRLHDLIEFAVLRFNMAPPADFESELIKKRKYVRSLVVPERIFQQTRADIQQILSREPCMIRRGVDLLLILAMRTGLRPKELYKLRLCDIEPTGDWLFVCSNQYGKNKTTTSRRRIDLGLLLASTEKQLFNEYLKRRMLFCDNNKGALLFSKSQLEQIPYAEQDINDLFSPSIKACLFIEAPLHQLRHSFSTNLMLTLFGSEKLIRTLTPYDLSHAKTMRKMIGGKHSSNRLWEVSGMMGHLTPDVTLASYSHAVDVLLHQYVDNADIHKSLNFWQNLCVISERKIRPLRALVDKNNCLNIDDVMPYIRAKLNTAIINSAEKDRRRLGVKPVATSTESIDIELCIKVLQLRDKGHPIQEICKRVPTDPRLVDRWIEMASSIKSMFITKKKQSRLFPANSNALCPPGPASKAEVAVLSSMQSAFEYHFIKRRTELTWCMGYVLNNVLASHAYIKFIEPTHLHKFLKIMDRLVHPDLWLLEVDVGNVEQHRSMWRVRESLKIRFCQKTVDRYTHYPCGLGRLYFLHPEWQQVLRTTKIRGSKYASQALQYLLHTNAIFHAGMDESPEPNHLLTYLAVSDSSFVHP